MLQHTDPATGLRLTLERDPEPRNPRLADDPPLHLVTWTRSLGDRHAWRTARHLLAVMRRVPALVLPVHAAWTHDKPSFSTILGEDDRAIGYAVALHERLRLHYGRDTITPDLVEAATLACDVELLAYEEFLHGDVHAFAVVTKEGHVLERRRGLAGSEWAEALAWQASAHHLADLRDDERSRRDA